MPEQSDIELSQRSTATRPSSHADFWDERYAQRFELFGEKPNAFIQEATQGFGSKSRVLDIAAGEGRNSIHLAREGHHVTMIDFSPVAIERLGKKMKAMGVESEVIRANILEWEPAETYDCIIVSFLQLLPEERPVLWSRVHEALAPGGRFIGLFFRPEQITEGYPSGGPSKLDRMVEAGELRRHFPEEGIRRLEPAVMSLREGILSGTAAVLQFIYERG